MSHVQYIPDSIEHERERLAALNRLAILDTPSERRFDRITQLTARVFDIPFAMVTLVDQDRLWFKSRFNLEEIELCREPYAFCSQALKEETLLVVEDASQHPLFSTNPKVSGPPGIRFYAGALLRAPSGWPLGTLCIMDTAPRTFSQKDREVLTELAQLVTSELWLSDETSQERTRARLESGRDPLLHCPGYQGMLDRIESVLSETPSAKTPNHLISLEIHEWETLNHLYGFAVENRVLVAAHERLRQLGADAGGETGRLGPARLAMLVRIENEHDMVAWRERLEDAFAPPYEVDGQEVRVTQRLWCLPLSCAFRQGRELLQALDYLDRQCSYSTGAPQVMDATGWSESIARRSAIRARLAGAIREHRLTLHYQPRIELVTRRSSGMEALLRWEDETLGRISPLEIIDIAEEAGLTIALDRWVLNQAIEQLAIWKARGLSLVPVSINLMPAFLCRPAVAQEIQAALEAHSLEGHWLELEILEHTVIEDIDTVLYNMQEIAALGVSLSIDDFGTGYSALTYLNRLPVDFVKIDRTFVRDMMTQKQTQALVQAIIHISHLSGFGVVAEGVETIEQYRLLEASGCRAIQGYLIARPSPADVACEWLADSSNLPIP